MNNRQLQRHLLAASAAGFAMLIAACSGDDEPSADPSDESGNSAGSAHVGGAASTAGAANGGSAASSSTELVGHFQVQVVASAADAGAGSTTVIGRVNDGPTPANIQWSVAQRDGDCRLEVPSAPFCDGGCSGDVCVEDGVCTPYPAALAVGEVTLKGVMVEGGGSELVLKEVAKSYQPPPGTMFAYPPFAEGDPVTLAATGGDYTPFELNARGVAPITFTSTDFELDVDKAFELTWDGAADPKSSRVHVKLDISHHGGVRGQISCDADDTGALTISAELMTELIGLGVAGFPSVILTRSSNHSAQIDVGRVELEVSSRIERFVSVAGFDSCNADEDCPDGKLCQSDLTCM